VRDLKNYKTSQLPAVARVNCRGSVVGIFPCMMNTNTDKFFSFTLSELLRTNPTNPFQSSQMSNLIQRAGDVSNDDSDLILLKKAEELKERATCKAESYDLFMMLSDSQKETRTKMLHKASRFDGRSGDVLPLQCVIEDGCDLESLFDSKEFLGISQGEDREIINAIGECTATHIAAVTGHDRALMCLVQHGTNYEALTKTGDRPLMVACKNGHTLCVKYLLTQGADMNEANANGETAWRVAFERHDNKGKTICKLLEEEGYEAEVKDTGCSIS